MYFLTINSNIKEIGISFSQGDYNESQDHGTKFWSEVFLINLDW